MIEIKNATVVKSGTKLFQKLNWRIKPGEHWVITGPNGSGKTTLLEIIAGVQHLVEGEIRYSFINGSSWDDRYAQRKRDIHLIPALASQTFLNFDPEMYYQQRYYSLGDERTPLVRDILGDNVSGLDELKIPDSLSIDFLLDLEITSLSNGQLKKVLFISNLIKGVPRFLLLDYPFEGLDIDSRVDLCAFIDFLVDAHDVQVILVDQNHQLPRCINHRLVLKDLHIVAQQPVSAEDAFIPHIEEERQSLSSGDAPIVEIEDLTLQYGDKKILENFSWTVRKGERWALVGRNGTGKTTLFSMIFADHPRAYSQKISLFGKRRGTGESIWDIKRRIQYVGSEVLNYLNPNGILSSARDYILVKNPGISESNLDRLIRYFHAEDFFDKPVRILSSGQLQLLMIINCFLADRELFLLDEPFQFLDPHQRIRVSDYLQSRMNADTTLILITHDERDLVHWAEKTRYI